MAVSLLQQLQPSFVAARIKDLFVINTTLQNAFGMGFGGSNSRLSINGTRSGVYDIFNDTREVATGRLPSSHAATIRRQPVGQVNYNIPRSAESMPLLMDTLNRLRPIGGPVSQLDANGVQYVMDQEQITRQRMVNLREFQVSAMLRGSYTYTISGDDLIHGYTGGDITVNYQVPAGNKDQLDMVGAGAIIGIAWDNPAAPIISDLFQINAAMIQLSGLGLRDVYLTSVMWGHVIANTQVQDTAGSVNQPFEFITRNDETEEFTARLKGAPWITFHINDNGLNLNGTFTKLIPDTATVFLPRMNSLIAQYWECGETVVEEWSRNQRFVIGEHYWYEPKGNPATYTLFSLFNGMPILLVPNAVVFGTTDF